MYLKSLLFLTLVCLLFSPVAFAGGEGVGGGGLICVTNAKCMTLAEAGLKPKPENYGSYFYLSPELVKEVKRVIDSYGWNKDFSKQLFNSTIGDPDTFVPVEVISKKKLAHLREQYLRIVKSMDPKFNLSKLKIVAWSDGPTVSDDILSPGLYTYLLPDFFKQPLHIQALTLIHERNIRYGGDLHSALEFDSYSAELVRNPEISDTRNFDLLDYDYLLSYLMGLKVDYHFGEVAVVQLEHMKGEPIRFNELCTENGINHPNPYDNYSCHINYPKLISLAKYSPLAVAQLKGLWIDVPEGFDPITPGSVLYDKYSTFCAKTPKAQLGDLGSAFFVKTKNITPSGLGLKLIRCGENAKGEIVPKSITASQSLSILWY